MLCIWCEIIQTAESHEVFSSVTKHFTFCPGQLRSGGRGAPRLSVVTFVVVAAAAAVVIVVGGGGVELLLLMLLTSLLLLLLLLLLLSFPLVIMISAGWFAVSCPSY